jgi:hypothetical protein
MRISPSPTSVGGDQAIARAVQGKATAPADAPAAAPSARYADRFEGATKSAGDGAQLKAGRTTAQSSDAEPRPINRQGRTGRKLGVGMD